MASKKLRQPFIAREGLPGNVIATGTLVAAANAKIRSKDPKLTPTLEQYDREVDYASLESLESLVGKVEMDAALSPSSSRARTRQWSVPVLGDGPRGLRLPPDHHDGIGGPWSGP
jgi:hypothetical protein